MTDETYDRRQFKYWYAARHLSPESELARIELRPRADICKDDLYTIMHRLWHATTYRRKSFDNWLKEVRGGTT